MTDVTVNIFPPGGTTPPAVPELPPAIVAAQDLQARRAQAFTRKDRQPIKAEIPTVKGDATTAVIRLYDVIDSWGMFFGVSAKEVATVLDELPDTVTEIRVLINSPGGEATEGMAILNLLRNHPAKVVSVVEGLAASAASMIAVGSDELVMSPNSELVIHDAWGLVIGNAADLRDYADTLDHISDSLAQVYAAKAGGTVEEWRAVMAKDTWYSAEEAVAAGLADSVLEPGNAVPPAARFDRSIFARQATPPAPPRSATPPSTMPRPGQKGASTMDVTDIREALGLAEDTSDEDVFTAALDRLTEPDPPAPEATPPALPDGTVAIDAATLEQLQAQAAAGVEARDEQKRQHRAALVKAAIDDGRIAPARSDHWLAQLEADPGAEQILEGLAKGLIPVNQLGTGGGEDLDTEFAELTALYGKDA